MLDQLTLLVDKSLLVADDCRGRTRYRLLETVRQYAAGKARASPGRRTPCGLVTATTTRRWLPCSTRRQTVSTSSACEQAEIEIDNLRAAFGWSRENFDIEPALALASSLQPLWVTRGRLREGLVWFDAALADQTAQEAAVAAAVYARALAGQGGPRCVRAPSTAACIAAEQALAIAREVDEPALLARALAACGFVAAESYNAEVAGACFAEAIGLARAVDDRWRLSQILALQAQGEHLAGDALRDARGGGGRARPRRRNRRWVQLA